MQAFAPFKLKRGLAHVSLTTVLTLSSQLTMAGSPAGPTGRWITASGNLEVDIAPCGKALCGTVTKVLGNRSMSRDEVEMKPVDTRPALGMTILSDFVPADSASPESPPTRWQGTIYNRENGKRYDCQMSLDTESNAAGELVLRAYVGIPLFGKTQRWHRAESAPAAAVKP